jgi:hypothetical protein
MSCDVASPTLPTGRLTKKKTCTIKVQASLVSNGRENIGKTEA